MSEKPGPKESLWRKVALGLGIFLIVASVVLYSWGLLQPPPGWEIWPMLGFLIFVPLGVFLLGEGTHKKKRLIKSNAEIRLAGPGEERTKKREEWVEAQTRRSYHITRVAITVIVVALALYAKNHVTGKLYPGKGEEKAHWQTHEQRLEAGSVYKTQEGDMLASVAVSQGISLTILAEANPAAELKVTEIMTSTRDSAKILSIPDDEKTLQEIAQKLGISTSEVALGFSGVTLKEDQDLRISKLPVVDYRQWFDWWLWALIGVAAYLLMEDARHYRGIPEGKGDFLGHTLWYWAQFLTGPLIAFVVLLVLTRIDLKLLGDENGAAIAVDMSQFALDLLFVPAFLLGFYSRVARQVLDDIMKSIFRSAWLAAHGEFEIVIQDRKPDDNVVESGEAVIFKTQPATDVNWFATGGDMGGATGAYTAPKDIDQAQDVVITAVAGRGVATASKIIRVVPLRFTVITVDGTELKVTPGGTLKLTIDPLPQEEAEQQKIAWEITSETKTETKISPQQGKETTLEVSDQEEPETSISVTATYKGHSELIAVEVVEDATPPVKPKLERIEARLTDGTLVKQNGEVNPESQVTFTVSHNLSSTEAEKIEWSTTAEAAHFKLAADPKGKSVVGKVPAGAIAGTQISVTAKYGELEPVSFTFKIAAPPES